MRCISTNFDGRATFMRLIDRDTIERVDDT
jgi:hypothetical protein